MTILPCFIVVPLQYPSMLKMMRQIALSIVELSKAAQKSYVQRPCSWVLVVTFRLFCVGQ